MDRREQLGFLPLQDDAAQELLTGVPLAERDATWHLVRSGRAPVGYGRGGRDLLLALQWTQALGRLLLLVPDEALDAAYGFVTRRRSRLGRLVPDRPGPRRYP